MSYPFVLRLMTCAVDESNRALKKLVDAGELGDIHAVESWCLDAQDPTGQ